LRFTRSAVWRRRFVLFLASYLVLAHLVIGISQKDAWPITTYCLLHGKADLRGGELFRFGFFGVDSHGREWRIDPYAWRAMGDWHLQYWFFINDKKLSAAERQTSLAWLYTLAERQRQRLARGEAAISWLGPISAPQWNLIPRELAVPAEPYRAFRVYKDTWYPADVLTGEKNYKRKLVGEWRCP
jgi:hypothetical protein